MSNGWSGPGCGGEGQGMSPGPNRDPHAAKERRADDLAARLWEMVKADSSMPPPFGTKHSIDEDGNLTLIASFDAGDWEEDGSDG